jgi:uncharacterized repeat protein (TIGR03803 family)
MVFKSNGLRANFQAGFFVAAALAACDVAPGIAHAASAAAVYSFAGGTDGANPEASLINVSGAVYGTTYSGGENGCGTVFKVAQTGAEAVLYSFKCGTDGANPEAKLLDVGGTLFGTTYNGGANGNGTVFAVTPAGAETVVYSFKGGDDGAHPAAGLINAGGTLFGTTLNGGGSKACKAGCGTVFRLTVSGNEKVVHAFAGGSDGASPYASLLDVGGLLYGATYFGGRTWGTVFSVSKAGPEKIIYAFKGPAFGDAGLPAANLINVGGTFYGTSVVGATEICGGSGCGAVFKLTPAGVESVVYSFPALAYPYAGLVNIKGTLFGTTYSTGATGGGTVFKVAQTGEVTPLVVFPATTSLMSGLLNVDGTLYGVTPGGGANGLGMVFKLVP